MPETPTTRDGAGAHPVPGAGARPPAPGVLALRRFDAAIARGESFLCVILVLAMVLLAFVQAVMRNAFDSGLDWADPLLKFMTLWVAFLGASLATFEGKHIAIDVLSRIVPRSVARMMRIAVSFIAAGICALLAYACFRYVREIGATEPPSVGNLPKWWFQTILPLAFGVMSARFVARGWLELLGHPPPTGDLPASPPPQAPVEAEMAAEAKGS